jgi:predicted HAD superfamily Cof-like phosphohydrolase
MSQPTNLELTRQFHQALGQVPPAPPNLTLRRDLIREEAREADLALFDLSAGVAGAREHVAKELADLLCVTYGTAVVLGIDLDAVYREVHASNMTKVGGPTRSDGKALKPATYQPPDLRGIVGAGGR